ncbi:hypothetical protein H0H81_003348 [Sphagnurus paluster]|uniref:RING-type domain-containing protein n=1 Tax=Sphagnurus paluster TaxID=117069 RepID=A0A9P7FN89_9AGAR|nr:hypothetical protein H0H81_003348 [Sphagnurus paluster]
MSLYNYVDTPNSNLICCICRTPFTDPVTTRSCAHTFCKDCILRAIEHSAQCPVDRSPLGPGNLVPANPIVRSLVDELVVECVHREEGCMFTSQRQLLPAHLLDSCVYREVPCPLGRCEEMIKFKDLGAHAHEDDQANEFDSTKTRDEKAKEESKKLGVDEESSQPQPNSPPPTRSPSPDPSESRIAALTEQNILLRHRVDRLEGLVHSFKRELGAVKRALGPWFRVGDGVEGTGYFSTELPVGAQAASASTSSAGLSPEITAEYPAPNWPTYPAAHGAVDSLAQYFPAEVDDVVAQRRGHRASASAEFMGGAYDPFSPRHAPPLVAPLNLGTTLEGTLHGLRESVVGLATNLESMGRRHEIALTNETTRMGEEVGGLRAGMHGLRMQVRGE